MPLTTHIESHFTGGELVRDIVIGMSDGLTVPFALAAGLSGAVSSSHVVVIAGLAEIAAGSIAMGLGGCEAVLVRSAPHRSWQQDCAARLLDRKIAGEKFLSLSALGKSANRRQNLLRR